LLSSAFQQHEEHPQIPIEIFSIDFILFSWKKWFNNQ
jgi:hypothetical protein